MPTTSFYSFTISSDKEKPLSTHLLAALNPAQTKYSTMGQYTLNNIAPVSVTPISENQLLLKSERPL
jgi:hypothetical protein